MGCIPSTVGGDATKPHRVLHLVNSSTGKKYRCLLPDKPVLSLKEVKEFAAKYPQFGSDAKRLELYTKDRKLVHANDKNLQEIWKQPVHVAQRYGNEPFYEDGAYPRPIPGKEPAKDALTVKWSHDNVLWWLDQQCADCGGPELAAALADDLAVDGTVLMTCSEQSLRDWGMNRFESVSARLRLLQKIRLLSRIISLPAVILPPQYSP